MNKDWVETKKETKKNYFFGDSSVCYVCGSKENLNFHHWTYQRYGKEVPSDLVVLCRRHHKKVHFSNSGKFYSDPVRISERVKKLKRHFIKMFGRPSGRSSLPAQRKGLYNNR